MKAKRGSPHHYNGKTPGNSQMFGLRQVVHKSLQQHEYKHRVSAAYQTFLPMLELLHHKIKIVKHQFIKAGIGASDTIILDVHTQQNVHPHIIHANFGGSRLWCLL